MISKRVDLCKCTIYINETYYKDKVVADASKTRTQCITLGLIINVLFDSSNCTVGGQIQSRSWFQLSLISNFWVGVRNGPLFKRDSPRSHHLIGKSHSIINDVACEGCGLFPIELLNATSKILKLK